jgi:hypothetical protein
MNRRRKFLISIVVVLGLAILIPYIHHHRLRAAVEACIAELKAKGEPMDLAQVIPSPIPPEQNSAPLITNALNQIKGYYTTMKSDPPGLSMIAPGKAMIGWRQPAIYNRSFNVTNSWEQLGTELVKEQDNLTKLRRLVDHPVLDFDLDYQASFDQSESGKGFRFYRLPQFKSAAQWLIGSAIFNLHQGKTTDACEDVRAILALVKGEADERIEISQLVRIAIAGMSVPAVWEILQDPNVSDEDLAQLQQDWQLLELISPMKRAFLVERVKTVQLINQLQHSPKNLETWIGVPGKSHQFQKVVDGTSTNWVLVDERSFLKKVSDGISMRWGKIQWRWFWSYKDEVRGLQLWQIMLAATQMAENNESFQTVQSFVSTNFIRLGFDLVKDDPYAFFSRNANQLASLRRTVNTETIRNIVVAAIALKRYENRYHRLPMTLKELTPNLLETVPADCMDGQSLRYRPNADGTFLLYSVGEDGKDNGGDVTLPTTSTSLYWQRGRDWVWPQAASAEEIQKYYEEQAKKSK